MSKKRKYACYEKVEKIFWCPLCGTSMSLENNKSMVCEKKHTFDFARTGYLNVIPNYRRAKYTKELFEHRRHILEAEFYQPLVECLVELVLKHSSNISSPFILDAGCGEGFYARKITESLQCEMFAMDIMKEAIMLASKSSRSIRWLVADLYNIPLQPNSMDIILNIFAPANYDEFSRIMKEEGVLIKVIPAQGYLQELRDCAQAQLRNKEYSNLAVVQLFEEQLQCMERKQLLYTLPVDRQQVYSFAKMTPMLFNVDLKELNLETIRQITIELEILVGKK